MVNLAMTIEPDDRQRAIELLRTDIDKGSELAAEALQRIERASEALGQ